MSVTASRIVRLAAALLVPVLLCPAARPDAFVEQYLAGVRLARAGRPRAALDRFAELARDNTASIPIHRALARQVLLAGDVNAWAERFRARLGRTSRDIGAAVGLAVLEQGRGRSGEARRFLLDAITAGGRDPLLVPLLLEAFPRGDELTLWLAARATVLPGDGRFAALRARVLLAYGRTTEARAVLEHMLGRDPTHPDVLVLHAELLRAAGASEQACAEVQAALPRLSGETRVPEVRVPARLAMVRVMAGCGQLDEAGRMMRSVGPTISLPGDPPLAQFAATAEAELALAREDPLAALGVLDEAGALADGFPEWAEVAVSVRVRALANLGLPVSAGGTVLTRPLPAGLAVADRAAALGALAATDAAGDAALGPAVTSAAHALAAQGLEPRATRLTILAAWLGPATRRAVPPARPEHLERARESFPAGAADVRVAAALVAARAAAARGDQRGALAVTARDVLETSGAPGRLTAAVGLVAARAALAAGEAERAAARVREALLELDSSFRERAVLAPEFEALGGPAAESALELAGVGFRAAIAAKRPPAQAADDLVRQLGRVVRGWSLVETPWPATVNEIARTIPGDACVVVTTFGADNPSLAIGHDAAFAVAPLRDAPGTPPCRDRRTVLWAGPGAPPAGLVLAPDDRRVVVRVVSPGVFARRATVPRAQPLPPLLVGPGVERPRRELVENLARSEGRALGETWASRFDASADWPVFEGAGLASSGSPLSSGWLGPPGEVSLDGWFGPETVESMPASPSAGLVALGVRMLPARGEPEKGAWVIAEAALSAGWRWALITRRPLAREERRRIESRLAEWARDPIAEARLLVRDDPALAGVLTLWTAQASVGPGLRRWYVTAGAMAAVALVAAALALRHALLRRRQPTTSNNPPGASRGPD